ncbi:MAG: metallophosphatase family protein [Desulfobacterales bacterium]|nr:metallophosphatase family protein [Desulfobacterales bacterium]
MAAKYHNKNSLTVGIISDTHGSLKPCVLKAFKQVDFIIHAGDIGHPEIIEILDNIAPVFAVRGNMDRGTWASKLPEAKVVEVGENLIYVLHDLLRLDIEPISVGFSAVISGHSHRPSVENRKGVLFLNPGSATQPRHGFMPSVALIHVEGMSLNVQFVELK